MVCRMAKDGTKMGRPTKFKEEYINVALDYTESYETHGDVIPTRSGLSDILQCTEDTLANWGKKNADFLGALEAIDTKQKRLLQNKGLRGDFRESMSKFLLSANHGMAEKSETKVSGGLSLEKILSGTDE